MKDGQLASNALQINSSSTYSIVIRTSAISSDDSDTLSKTKYESNNDSISTSVFSNSPSASDDRMKLESIVESEIIESQSIIPLSE